MTLIYKIVPQDLWSRACAAGVFEGAPVDLADGFIHFSTAGQVRETAARHFAGQSNLLLVAFRSGDLGEALKWEPSRGGDLFPHLYAALQTGSALWAEPLPLATDGTHIFPNMEQ